LWRNWDTQIGVILEGTQRVTFFRDPKEKELIQHAEQARDPQTGKWQAADEVQPGGVILLQLIQTCGFLLSMYLPGNETAPSEHTIFSPLNEHSVGSSHSVFTLVD
jgi:hypothetical protein